MGDRNHDESDASGPPPGERTSSEDDREDESAHVDDVVEVDDELADGDDPGGTLTGTVVLNALGDVVSEERAVLADEESVQVLRDAYRARTTSAERTVVADAFEDVQDGSEADAADKERSTADEREFDGADEQALTDAVAATVDELAARDATLTVDHEVPLDLDDRPVRVHRFFATRDEAVLAPLADDDTVADAFEQGGAAARDDSMETAATAFETAIEATDDAETAVAARVLAAWANHRAGDDESALDLVRDALLEDADAWDARLVGVAADHSSPDWFREGRLASEAYLRARSAIPDGASVDAGIVDDVDGSVEWLDGDPACFPVGRLPLEGRLRLRLVGPPGGLPSLYAYYLAVGVVEPESANPRTVEDTLLDGPVTAAATERLRIRLP